MYKDLTYTGQHKEDNWFYKRYYYSGSNCRYFTYQAALNLISQRFSSPVIVETGCQRQEEDLGGGMSTSIFAEYVDRYGGSLITVDNNSHHLGLAKKFGQRWPDAQITYALSDSVAYLQQYNDPIHLLYLDSYDYPVGEMWNAYGGKTDLPRAIKILESKSSDEIMKEFSSIIIPCQEHCLKEFQAAEDNLLQHSVILVDDNDFPGGGKPGLLKLYLEGQGYLCLLDSQQTLWIKV